MAIELILLPGLDGTGELFEPLVRILPAEVQPVIVSYPLDRELGYADLLPIVKAALPRGEDFFLAAESFSGPLAVEIAAEALPRLKGVVLCASFVKSPYPALVLEKREFNVRIRSGSNPAPR